MEKGDTLRKVQHTLIYLVLSIFFFVCLFVFWGDTKIKFCKWVANFFSLNCMRAFYKILSSCCPLEASKNMDWFWLVFRRRTRKKEKKAFMKATFRIYVLIFTQGHFILNLWLWQICLLFIPFDVLCSVTFSQRLELYLSMIRETYF